MIRVFWPTGKELIGRGSVRCGRCGALGRSEGGSVAVGLCNRCRREPKRLAMREDLDRPTGRQGVTVGKRRVGQSLDPHAPLFVSGQDRRL